MEEQRAAPRIFIVEDEAVVACALERQLISFGYEVSGIALAERCRERYGAAVVFLTGYADPETVSRPARVQPYSFLVKPYSERELRAAIEIALYRHSAEAGLAGYRLHLEELVVMRTAELQESNRCLEAALAQVKRLSGLIPICMYCRRVRDEGKRWRKIEEYVSAHSEADFSHGLRPECYETKVEE